MIICICKIFNSKQCCFPKDYSGDHEFIQLVSDTHEEFEQIKFTLEVFIDLS